MAANALRLRRSLALTSSILNNSRNFTSVLPSVAPPPSSSPSTSQQNPNLFNFTQSKSSSLLSFKFISSRNISSRARYNNDDLDGDQISPDAILFEGCDYNHWLITMDFPKDPKPSPEEMVETYVQTAAKVLGSVEEAKKKIYACSTTTYEGFQVEVSEEVSEQFKGLPGVVFVLPDSYIDPVNKEYGGDKYINGTIIPRPPPVQYGRQSGRYNDRNRDYNRPPRGNAPGGQGNYQGDGRGPVPSYQANYNQGDGRNVNHARQTDFPQRDQGNFQQSDQRGFREGRNFTPPPVGGDNSQGGGGSYRQGTGGQYGQGRVGGYGQGTGGQYGHGGGGNYGQGGGGNYGQGGGGNYGQGGGGNFGQGGGGNYGQGGGGNYGQGGGGNYGQGGGRNYGQGGGGNYGQGMGGQYGQVSGGSYGQQGGGQMGDGNYGQRAGGQYGQGTGYGSNQTSPQYGENPNPNSSHVDNKSNINGQHGNYEVTEEAEAFKGR